MKRGCNDCSISSKTGSKEKGKVGKFPMKRQARVKGGRQRVLRWKFEDSGCRVKLLAASVARSPGHDKSGKSQMVCDTMSSNSPLYRALKLNMRQHGSWLKSLNSTSTKFSQIVTLDGAHIVMEDNSMEKFFHIRIFTTLALLL